jgi:EpsI family protein
MSKTTSNIIQVLVNNILERGWAQTKTVLLLAVVILLMGGAAYRIASAELKRIIGAQIELDRPLSSFPLQFIDWRGEDVPIPVNVQRVAGADEFLSRLYVNSTDKTWVNLYVAYTARPRNMLGHQPEICYPASGWIHDYTDHIEVITKSGRHIPCLLHHFHKPEREREERVVLNYYVVNGRLTDDESVFSGIGWRTPNIDGNPARYVAQVQISSTLEGSVRRTAEEMSDALIALFPNGNGGAGSSDEHSGSGSSRM